MVITQVEETDGAELAAVIVSASERAPLEDFSSPPRSSHLATCASSFILGRQSFFIFKAIN